MNLIVTHKGFFVAAVLCFFSVSCSGSPELSLEDVDFRGEMRRLIREISQYGEGKSPGFIVIPQNGQELLTLDGSSSGLPAHDYIEAIDGVGREDLFYGYEGDNRSTPDLALQYMLSYLNLAKSRGLRVLSIDYCHSPDKMADSVERNGKEDFLVFAADRRSLDGFPPYPPEPVGRNDRSIENLDEASNFLYLINPAQYPSREKLLDDLENSLYDILIIDLFDEEGRILSADDIARLKRKPGGGSRLVISYMSIGEAEDYRYYWQDAWSSEPPRWLGDENREWQGNYKVHYWDSKWKKILYGQDNSYLDLILSKGFDGVYLDLVDAFWYFENIFTK